MSRSTAGLFLPVVVLLAIAAAVYTEPWHELSVGNTNGPLGHATSARAASSISGQEEARFAEQWMASEITGLELGRVNAKVVSNVRCTRATAWPSTFAGDPGHAYDCTATFSNSSATQRWCALYDPNHSNLITDYQSAKMCEGPPNPKTEP